MKISNAAALVLMALSQQAESFTIVGSHRAGISNTALFSTVRPDASAAIKAALEASKKYGPTSPEARVAWDTVEEIDSSDNSAAFAPSLDEECSLSEDEISQACVEYGEKLDTLFSMIENQVPKMEAVKSLASEMKAIKMTVAKSQPSEMGASPQMKAALAEAKSATEKFGIDSPEARVAWDNVEEIAASGTSNAMGTRLDEECLVDTAMEACQALDELNRVLNLRKTKQG